MSCTVVTAYYNVKSKRPAEEYFKWIGNFLKLTCNIVVFTDDASKHLFEGNSNIHIIIKLITDFFVYKKYGYQFWCDQYEIDHEKYHTPECYLIWNEKVNFVKDAIDINPFKSTHFFWLDVGAFRNESHMHMFSDFPIVSKFPTDKILFSCMSNLTSDECKKKEDGIYGDFKKDFLVGGLWGGDKTTYLKWHDIYYAQVDKYIAAGRFAGKEQVNMLSAIIENPNIACIATPNIGCNPWFYLEYYLGTQNIPLQVYNIEQLKQ